MMGVRPANTPAICGATAFITAVSCGVTDFSSAGICANAADSAGTIGAPICAIAAFAGPASPVSCAFSFGLVATTPPMRPPIIATPIPAPITPASAGSVASAAPIAGASSAIFAGMARMTGPIPAIRCAPNPFANESPAPPPTCPQNHRSSRPRRLPRRTSRRPR